DGVKIDKDRRVRRAGEPGPDVRRRHLDAEQEAQHDERAPLGGLAPKAGEAAGGPGPEADHGAADDESHTRQAERRGLLEAHLDDYGIRAPEDRDEHGHGRALEVDVFRRVAQQNALEDTTPGIIAP